MIAMESLIMFKRNKTAKWLQTKSKQDKDKLFKACISLGRQQRQLNREREATIQAYRQQVLKQKEESIIKRQSAERKKKEALCYQISEVGFWNSPEKVKAGLSGKSECKQRSYLQTQLRFRKHVLKQSYPEDKSVYCFSRMRRKLSSTELSANLLKLIDAFTVPTIEDILKVPDRLVGVCIRHRFEEEGVLKWYHGVVVGVLESKEFEVIYTGEQEICEFDLMQDYYKGDLEVVT